MNEHLFQCSAWSERLWGNKQLWVGSAVDVEFALVTQHGIPANESSVEVDRSLPLNAAAHNALGHRINVDFKRATMTVYNPERRKQMRMDEGRMIIVRSVVAFWYQQQVHDLHKALLKGETFKELEDLRINSNFNPLCDSGTRAFPNAYRDISVHTHVCTGLATYVC